MLSIILPFYNNKALSLRNIGILDKFLRQTGITYEIILVDDGSAAPEAPDEHDLAPSVKLIRSSHNKGKGFAVKQGMLAARGECRIYTDIDLPYDLAAIPYAYDLVVNKKFNFVAGDRTLNHSQFKVELPFLRRIASKIFSKIVTLFVVGGINDSQCGFKAFSGKLSDGLFRILTIDRFGFDVEIYYILLKYNILIKRIPVRLLHADVSSVRVALHAFEMVKEIVKIPLKWRKGAYESGTLRDLESEIYWNDPAKG